MSCKSDMNITTRNQPLERKTQQIINMKNSSKEIQYNLDITEYRETVDTIHFRSNEKDM